jgi:hypothetical protein
VELAMELHHGEGACSTCHHILSTDLALDVTTHAGSATIALVGSATSTGASFEVGDLVVGSVEGPSGPLNFVQNGAQLDVGVPSGTGDAQLTVDYTFAEHYSLDGWSTAEGVSFLWPYFCGNLFPCHSNPWDGLTFTLDVTGVPSGSVAVYPTEIPADAPSYQIALAVGPYVELPLGTTSDGTDVSVWYRTDVDDEKEARDGTKNLVDIFDFYEQTYGPYTFGTKVGSVSADWGGGAYGGMEHHPYWHIGQFDLGNPSVHAHEAGHGWYGDGVRLACWEDFVLSEGTDSYLEVHSQEVVANEDHWPDFGGWLDAICNVPDYGYYGQYIAAYPQTCDATIWDPLDNFTGVPYVKGACFYEDVGDLIGTDVLDQTLSDFYQLHVGGYAHMSDMIAALKAASPADAAEIDSLADEWLIQAACPTDAVARTSRGSPGPFCVNPKQTRPGTSRYRPPRNGSDRCG